MKRWQSLFHSIVSLVMLLGSNVLCALAAEGSKTNKITSEVQDLKSEDLLELEARKQARITSKKVGDAVEDFALKDATGRVQKLGDLLKSGPVVIAFYRGNWCPFCTSELRDLEVNLPAFQKLKTTLVAISPQIPSQSEYTTVKDQLTFPVLSDPENNVAKKFGLVYKIKQGTRSRLQTRGVDLTKVNGTDTDELPLPGTFLISPEFKILFAFVDEDFRHRAKAADVIEAIRNQNQVLKTTN